MATGLGSVAAGTLSQAHGRMNTASGPYGFAIGQDTEAGFGAFSSGRATKALGNHSHTEGVETTAEGMRSHAEGY
jgi:hypothetical protein